MPDIARSQNRIIAGLRASLFYLGFYLLTIWFSLTGVLLFSYAPYRIRARYMVTWNFCTVYWLRMTCGVRFQIIGKENLPTAPFVAVANHQSQWETYFLQGYLFPVCFVLKQELLKLPFFGWGLKMVESIAIDRANPRQAMRQTQDEGLKRLASGKSVLIFPEGTRRKPGDPGKFARGGASLALAANVPLVPIALNAGEFWPADKFLKIPGTITVAIGPAILDSSLDSRALSDRAEQWIKLQLEKISATQPSNHSL